jgi:hypothetical protein
MITPVTAEPILPGIPTSWAPMLIIAIVALAGAIVILWRYYALELKTLNAERLKERELWAEERERWVGERERIRAEYDKRYILELERLHKEGREHEATVRREYAENMEIVAAKAEESNGKVAAVLDKIYNRFIGPRRHQKD